MRDGEIVFDGTAKDVTADVLTDIYGEEDWSTTIRKDDEEDEDGEDPGDDKEKKKDKGFIREASSG